MKSRTSTRYGRFLSALGLVLGLPLAAGTLGLLEAPRSAEAQAQKPATATLVHLSKYGNDLHAVFMALHAARALQGTGGDVSLLLDLEGVRLADARAPLDLRWGTSDTTLRELYDGFVKAGGKVLICSHCAAAAGLDAKSLRPGARIVNEGDIARAIQSSSQVIDY